MLSLDVNLVNNPVFLTCPTQRPESDRHDYDHLTGFVVLSNDGEKRAIGGVKVVWEVRVEQLDGTERMSRNKCAGKQGKDTGRPYHVVDRYERVVVEAMVLNHGTTRLEYGISVRPEIELSRMTRFDKTYHVLIGTIIPPSFSLMTSTTGANNVQDLPCLPGYTPDALCSSTQVTLSSPTVDSSETSSCNHSLHSTSSDLQHAGHLPSARSDAVNRPFRCISQNRSFTPHRSAPIGLLARLKESLSSSANPRPRYVDETDKPVSMMNMVRPGEEHLHLAHCEREVPVHSLDISGEYNWMHSQSIPQMGGAGIKIDFSSDALVLGGNMTANLTLTSLPADMTIHTVTIRLIQTTTGPIRRSAEDGNISEDEMQEGIDEYTLSSIGKAPVSLLFGWTFGKYYTRKDVLWRHGYTVTPTANSGDDNGTADLHMVMRPRLPSPALGTAFTTEHPTPDRTCIAHDFWVVIHFSQTGKDADGEALQERDAPRLTTVRGRGGAKGRKQGDGGTSAAKGDVGGREGQQVEGAVRSWILSKGVILGSHLGISPSTIAPSYDRHTDGGTGVQGSSLLSSRSPAKHTTSHREPNSSFTIPHKQSFAVGGSTYMRPVYRRDEEIGRLEKEHWAESGGLCACFAHYTDTKASNQAENALGAAKEKAY